MAFAEMLLPVFVSQRLRMLEPEYLVAVILQMIKQRIAQNVRLPILICLRTERAFPVPCDMEFGMVGDFDNPLPFLGRCILNNPSDRCYALGRVLPAGEQQRAGSIGEIQAHAEYVRNGQSKNKN